MIRINWRFLSEIFVKAMASAALLAAASCALGNAEMADYEGSSLSSAKEAPAVSRSFAEEIGEAPMDELSPLEDADADDVPEDQGEERKRVYSGSAGLVVEDVEDTRRTLERIAAESGGYVEGSYHDYVVIRVPADQFDSIFADVLTLGRVEYSTVESRDVTEAYADIERRLKTAEETRDRLYVLLERSTDPQERAKILREIGRLTEEIESLRQQITVMENRIAYSRITIQLIPRIANEFTREQIPFPWIAQLDPLVPAGRRLRGKLNLDVGDDFAVFDKEDVFFAENSDGVHISISSVDNSPRGSADFWQRALDFHLSPYYAESTRKDIRIGDDRLVGVELISKDREPFMYFVGVVVDRESLHVVEVFSPDAAGGFDSFYRTLAEGSLR